MSNIVKESISNIREEFDKNKKLKQQYLDKLATLLYEEYGLRGYCVRNRAAEDILKKIFYD